MNLKRLLFAAIASLGSFFAVGQPVKIEFTSFTRGFQKQAFFSADSVVQISNKRGVMTVSKRKIDSLAWQTLMKAVEEVQLSTLKDLPAPSARRTFDGAMHSTLTIITADGSKYSHSFDDEYPHEKLHPLMEAIKDLIGENVER
jgi:hypothetical protein